MSCVLFAVALLACSSDEQIGSNDPDARSTDAAIDAPADAASCACGPSSCGSRICGRSACGFPCGECAPGEFCFVGTECQAGVGPGTPCVDAFGDRVWEGDRGFRACPTDPGTQQACTCTGGGATAWASCDASCVEICAQVPSGLACGAPGCDVGTEVCCIPTGMTDTRTCAAGSCAANHYTRACDGPEDCGTGVCCGGDNLWTAGCVPSTGCAPLEQYCHSAADCGVAAPYCCPGAVADLRACAATLATGCN